MMRMFSLMTMVIVTFSGYCQNFNVGLSFDASTPLISSKEKSIETQNANQNFPYDDHLIEPNSLWYTYDFGIDFYYGDKIKLIGSLGLRSFNFGWSIDTVSITYYTGSINPPTGNFVTVYGSQERLFGYFLPTLSLGVELPLTENLSLRNQVSYGYLSFMQKRRKRSTAFDESNQGAFDYIDGGQKKAHYSTYLKKDVFDLKISSAISYNINRLSLYAGLSFYYLKSSFVQYGGLHLDIGITYKVLKKRV